MPKASRQTVRVGPEDHGRRMTLDHFDRAIGREGYVYELHNGVVEVSDIPDPVHLIQMQAVRNQLVLYRVARPQTVYAVAGLGESKILVTDPESERHPDLSVYLSPPPDVPDVWSVWVPAIVIEVVSKSSVERDYEDKPAEYFEFGVHENWIVDATKAQMTVLFRWRGRWKEKVVKPSQKYTTRHLPGFSLDLKRVFAAAK